MGSLHMTRMRHVLCVCARCAALAKGEGCREFKLGVTATGSGLTVCGLYGNKDYRRAKHVFPSELPV
eukprot:6205421-Amphidinium_carterae.2